MNERVKQLIEARKLIDKELLYEYGIHIENGEPCMEIQYSSSQIQEMSREVERSSLKDAAKRANDYIDFQTFNIGSCFPGWRSRLNETWNGEKYRD